MSRDYTRTMLLSDRNPHATLNILACAASAKHFTKDPYQPPTCRSSSRLSRYVHVHLPDGVSYSAYMPQGKTITLEVESSDTIGTHSYPTNVHYANPETLAMRIFRIARHRC